jgi:hypothetical protein
MLLLNWESTQFPPPNTDGAPAGFWVAGYRVYWSTLPDTQPPVFRGPFYHSIDVGRSTHWEPVQAENVWYCYAVTCYDVWGRESEFSNFNLVIYVRPKQSQ